MAMALNELRETESAKRAYDRFSYRLKANNIVKVDENTLLVTTNPVLEDRGPLFTEKWTRVVFRFRYRLDHPDVIECREQDTDDPVSMADFLRIRATGRKICKHFFCSAMYDYTAEARVLDLAVPSEILMIVAHYDKLTHEYESLIMRATEAMIDKDKYERDLGNHERWNKIYKETSERYFAELDDGEEDEDEEDNDDAENDEKKEKDEEAEAVVVAVP